jgi:hypothetical protein
MTLRRKKAPIYATYGNIYTTFGLGVRHTGHPGRPTRPGFSAGVLRPLVRTLAEERYLYIDCIIYLHLVTRGYLMV